MDDESTRYSVPESIKRTENTINTTLRLFVESLPDGYFVNSVVARAGRENGKIVTYVSIEVKVQGR